MEQVVFGGRMNIPKGTTFFKTGENVEHVYLLVNGQVRAKSEYMKMNLDNGALLGILDIYSEEYLFDYEAVTDLIVLCFDIAHADGIQKLLKLGKNYQEIAVNSLFAQFHEVYRLYEKSFLSYASEMDDFNVIDKEEDSAKVDMEICTYMNQIYALDKKVFHELFTAGEMIAYEHLITGSKLVADINRTALKLVDVLGKAALGIQDDEAQNKAADDLLNGEDTAEEGMDESAYDYALVESELANSMKQILDYSQIDEKEASRFTLMVSQYMNLPDRNTSDNDVRKLRKDIAEQFYQIYENVFLHSLKDTSLSRAVELFLNFGFMDEKEFDKKGLAELYYFKPDLSGTGFSIYTVYGWLKAIYEGKREPSKDEFDQDYKENVRKEKALHHLSAAEETKMLSDQTAKVQFEIRNMFKVINRLTTNEITIFSPILTQRKFSKSIQKSFLSAKKLSEAMRAIMKVDYSLFHREQMYYDPENKIDNIVVMKQVLPDFILMPNVGSRGVMWQDISEKKRDTPARFVLSAFFNGNLENSLINMAAVYRWEICRTVQGNYWNDVREHSLTSEYCDYVQFYRKNKDLTEEAKEKIRAQFKSCRNSYREMFAKDYDVWVKYESQNSIRLNKVVRGILYMYCPFAAEYRKKLESQPIFNAASARFNRENTKKVRELKTFNSNVLKRGGQVTEVLQKNLDFYELG